MSYIGIIDYGAGNLMSVANALKYIGCQSRIVTDKEGIQGARSIILPGVGAFPDAMEALTRSGLIPEIKKAAQQKPFLGICLGMQLLFERSDEVRPTEGLGILPGEVSLIKTPLKLPQIGWNALEEINPCALLESGTSPYVYFVHSFMVNAARQEDVAAVCDYSARVTAMVARDNVFGCQFHPEKSGQAGLDMLRRFARL